MNQIKQNAVINIIVNVTEEPRSCVIIKYNVNKSKGSIFNPCSVRPRLSLKKVPQNVDKTLRLLRYIFPDEIITFKY